jgi:hypothetical protein
VLEQRGLAVTAELPDRIRACLDRDLLDRWAELAWTVSRAEEIFAGDA